MAQNVKKIGKQLISFICDQYLIIFLITTVGYQLAFFNQFTIKVTWNQANFNSGVFYGYLAAGLIFMPLFFVKKRKNLIGIIIATVIAALLLVDAVYFSYFSSLPTVGLLNSLNQTAGVGPAIATLLNWSLLLYFVIVAAAILINIIFKKYFNPKIEKYKNQTANRNISIITAISILAIFLFNFNFTNPISVSDIINKGYDTKSTAQYYGVLMAHAFDITRYINQEFTHLSTDQEKEIATWAQTNMPTGETNLLMKSVTTASDEQDFSGIAKGKNVIMIQAESLGGFVIDQKINGKEITPVLNKLATTSQFFPNERFVIGAGHTSDADLVANTSFFPLEDAATFVRFGQDDFSGLPKVFTKNGYSAYAYHGYNRNFWNRNVAITSLGYEKFFAADNFSKAEMLNMGLNDGTFLSETADYISKQPKPSFSYVITLSSHVPFQIKDFNKELGINTADYPDQVGGYLENIHYVDKQLGLFFEKLKKDNLYDDSLIVIYGDHVPVLKKFEAGTIKYDPATNQGKEVPLFVKLPDSTEGKVYPNIGNHLNIMPTILDLAGIKTNQLMFGNNMFDTNSEQYNYCDNQIATFASLGNCTDALRIEKSYSEKIIRYNLFEKINKN